MFTQFERAVALRYLRARRGERFVSVIAAFSLVGIALGVATLIIVMAVMSGFKVELLKSILGFNGDLGVYAAQSSGIPDFDAVVAKIAAVPSVVSATPLIEGQVLFSANGANSGGLVRGMRPADIRAVPAIADHLKSGSLNDFAGDDVIAVGVTLAQRFGLGVGSKLTLISPDGAVTAFGTIPRVRAYRIVAIYDAGMNEYNAAYVFIPLQAAQIYFQKPNTVTEIQVSVANPDRVGAVTAAVRAALGDTPARVLDWTQSNDSFFAAVTVEQNVMFLILTLIIVVAAFNVISSLIMMVKDKTADIAVLRTIGASSGAIMRIFLLCGASVGITGTLTGTLIGVVFCANIERLRQFLQTATHTTLFDPTVYYLTHLPAKMDPVTVAQIVAMALFLSLIATLYPSWRAARTDPVEALRHE